MNEKSLREASWGESSTKVYRSQEKGQTEAVAFHRKQ